MAKGSKNILKRVSHLGDGDSSRDIYDDWSASYDAHLLDDFGYVSPRVAAEALTDACGRCDIEVMDYGCGTGLVGAALRQAGFSAIDGIDISEGMLAQARAKNLYRNLLCGDLTDAIALGDEVYDAAVCIGSMGAGHIGAQHVPELIRPLKNEGIFIVIMNGMYYETGGFEQAFRGLEDNGTWRIRRLERFNYMTELDRPGWLLVASRS